MKTDRKEQPHGKLITLLKQHGVITDHQIQHAVRIQEKLTVPRALYTILRELDMVSDEALRKVLKQDGTSVRLGELLAELGYISSGDLDSALALLQQKAGKEKLGQILVKHNFIDEQRLLQVLSLQLGLPVVEPNLTMIDQEAMTKVPAKILEKHCLLPIKQDGKPLIATADPLDPDGLRDLRRFLGSKLELALSGATVLKKALEMALVRYSSGAQRTVTDSSVVGTVNSIILAAVEKRASDIHIEPFSDRLQVRFREDGVLQVYKDFPLETASSLVSRIKVMSKADIAERRRHQGGRMLFEYSGGELDIRVSIYVTVHGEKVVMRLLNRMDQVLDMHSLGMAPRMLSRFLDEAVNRPSGVLLVTGPTGSGKTSTVYSCINHIKNPQVSIITAEEPVEYVLDGIAQCSINPEINLTFDETLRHIVRQDPDVIVIGEIRDVYSADVAVQAALTGHKVLTTFHTEDSIGGLIRLLNMDIAPFLISSTVISVLAQRLVRRVCPACKVPAQPSTHALQQLGCAPNDLAGVHFVQGRGCAECSYTGYRGRVGVFELLVLDEPVRNAILEQKTSHEIRQLSIEQSELITLFEDGLVKAAAGQTTLDELFRCLPRLAKPRPINLLRRLCGE